MQLKLETFNAGARVSVLLPLPLKSRYDYLVPAGCCFHTGDFVSIPLGKRQVSGVIWAPAIGEDERSDIKEIICKHEVPKLSSDCRRFIDWVAIYTFSSPGIILRMAMSVSSVFKPASPKFVYRVSGLLPDKMTQARGDVISLLSDGLPRTQSDICRITGVNPSVVRGLEKLKTLERHLLSEEAGTQALSFERLGPKLSDYQSKAASHLKKRVNRGDFNVTVIDGVPGSGKTEVYLEGVAAALLKGCQVLVLLPEIALTANWLDQFKERFGILPAQWHSELSQSVRRRTWHEVASGMARVVVGARSALFLPFPELGYIVVDEEHEVAYKQEEGVIYNARDMSVARAHLANFPIVLVSATPSLETVVNIDNDRYERVHLPERHGNAKLPTIEVVNMREVVIPSGTWISPTLKKAMKTALQNSEQVMLFLNRRGYAPLTLCRKCGFRFECDKCSAWLVEHRRVGRLMCHHCGFSIKTPEACPECGSEGQFEACGPGVERLADEVLNIFPEARIEVVTSDTLTGMAKTHDLIQRIEKREVDIIIGTQILAKGHHFPMLTLVGVIDADLGLGGGDLRAAERTHQLLYQVAGRSGRSDRPGRVLLQTYVQDHPVMAALISGTREAFLEQEKQARKSAGMPPFGRLVAFIISGQDEGAVSKTARNLAAAAPCIEGAMVFGPAPAPFFILRGNYRYRLLFKSARSSSIQQAMRKWVDRVSCPSNVRIQIDVDPYSFF